MNKKNVLLVLLFLFTVTAYLADTTPAHAAKFTPKAEDTSATVDSLDSDDEYLDAVAVVVYDPIEGFNRGVHSVNDFILTYVAQPVSTGYTYVTPGFFRRGLKNFFYNALFPVRFVNNLLQGKGRAAGVEMSRFVLNTTAGLGGFIDVAKNHKTIVTVDDEDFGQTLGTWGVGEGFYIVLPMLGPSTARDTVGIVADKFLDPITYVSPTSVNYGLSTLRIVNGLDDILDQYDVINKTAIEPYSAFRDAYIQHRRAKVKK